MCGLESLRLRLRLWLWLWRLLLWRRCHGSLGIVGVPQRLYLLQGQHFDSHKPSRIKLAKPTVDQAARQALSQHISRQAPPAIGERNGIRHMARVAVPRLDVDETLAQCRREGQHMRAAEGSVDW